MSSVTNVYGYASLKYKFKHNELRSTCEIQFNSQFTRFNDRKWIPMVEVARQVMTLSPLNTLR